MTKGELFKVLNDYPDDAVMSFTLYGAVHRFSVDKVIRAFDGSTVCLCCDDAPEFDDIKGMADACWEDYYKTLGPKEKNALSAFFREVEHEG